MRACVYVTDGPSDLSICYLVSGYEYETKCKNNSLSLDGKSNDKFYTKDNYKA